MYKGKTLYAISKAKGREGLFGLCVGLVCDGDEGRCGVGGGKNHFGALLVGGGDSDAEAGDAGGVGNNHKKISLPYGVTRRCMV